MNKTMPKTASDFIHFLENNQQLSTLNTGRIGIEKEGLRYKPTHQLSTDPHPAALGHPLTHEQITTDFAESLLELVTPAMPTNASALKQLENLHHIISHSQPDYILNSSMPAYLDNPETVAIGYYGESNSGQMRRLYRQGLSKRYGRAMQLIAGIHYNFSFDDRLFDAIQPIITVSSSATSQTMIDAGYLNVIRNLRQLSWLTVYLFGHSPTLDRSFFHGRSHQLETLGDDTLCLPYATSLRLSDIGYQSKTDEIISANSLADYQHDLRKAVLTPSPDFEAIGRYDKNGNLQQMNTHLLQIENEYYTVARPKQITAPGEPPIKALAERGIAYVELRTLDINCFSATGIDEAQLDFLQIMMLYCLFENNPALSEAQERESKNNLSKVACCGRDPNLLLSNNGAKTSIPEWGNQLIAAMQPIAQALDMLQSTTRYSKTLAQQKDRLLNPEKTPSEKVMQALTQVENNQPLSYHQWITTLSQDYDNHWKNTPLNQEQIDWRNTLSHASFDKEKQLVTQSQSTPFTDYLSNYYAQIESLQGASK